MLTFAKVTLGYNGRHVLEDINLVVNKGDFIGLVGPNGAGKSTLMKAMLGLVKPRAGSISWRPDIPKIGYVPQSEHIDPIWPMRVRDVLHLTLCSLERPHFFHKKEHSRVRQVMEMIAIESLANRTLDTLSGGELQRVLLARALIIEPDVLFLDEPTAAMDLVATRKFLSMISDLHRDHGITVVIVTHDLQSLAHRAEYLGIIANGKLYFDQTDTMLTSGNLTEIYGQPMTVRKVDGRALIWADEITEKAGFRHV